MIYGCTLLSPCVALVFESGLTHAGVTVIWVFPCFGYPRTQSPSVLGYPKY